MVTAGWLQGNQTLDTTPDDKARITRAFVFLGCEGGIDLSGAAFAALPLQALRPKASRPDSALGRVCRPQGSHQTSQNPINDKARAGRALAFMAEKEGLLKTGWGLF